MIFFISFSAQAMASLVDVPGDRLGDHVGQDERVGDELDLVGGRRRPAVGVVLHALALEGGELRIASSAPGDPAASS